MVSEINSNGISSLQTLRATSAFKSTNTKANKQSEEVIPQQEEDISLKSDFVTEGKLANLNKKSMSEIKTVAQKIGDELSDEDIKYGLMYGRSVLIDYSA